MVGRWIKAQQDPHVAGAAAEDGMAGGGRGRRNYPDILPDSEDLVAVPLDPSCWRRGRRIGRGGGHVEAQVMFSRCWRVARHVSVVNSPDGYLWSRPAASLFENFVGGAVRGLTGWNECIR